MATWERELPMVQGQSTRIILMVNWIWTSALSIRNSLSTCVQRHAWLATGESRSQEKVPSHDHS